MSPRVNHKRARFVLTKIDEIPAWERQKDTERDTMFVELGRNLCEVRAGQHWRLQNLKSLDEFLERRFPESRRKAYYLMSIHQHLPPEARKDLKQVGWTKGLELAKVARKDGPHFDCATWVHEAREMPKEEFKREVEKEITGRETEPHEIIYFKVYKTQIPVIEQALETAGRCWVRTSPVLLHGNDMCGFPGGGKSVRTTTPKPGCNRLLGFQVSSPIPEAGIPRTVGRGSHEANLYEDSPHAASFEKLSGALQQGTGKRPREASELR
jgi:hypothetical protein